MLNKVSQDSARILTINTGSSSLKAALYAMGDGERMVFSARADRIGQPGSSLRIIGLQRDLLHSAQFDGTDEGAALKALLDWQRQGPFGAPDAIGHRLVHGGNEYREPTRLTGPVIAALRGLAPLDPDHLPRALDAIGTTRAAFPTIPQVACFDTTFHRHMPPVAQMYPLPRELADAGVIRYGFHGLSYESIMEQLRTLDSTAANGRIIIAHLGSGASMVAVRDGRGIDTTMGFTPTGGLMMGTRSGDLDPGVILYLLAARGMNAEALGEMVNRQSGLLGLSGSSADMRDLLEREVSDPHAAEAIDLFCYQARKFLGALAAVLGGLQTLIFTGGIGERAAPVRARICTGLEFLGIHLDQARNAKQAPIISADHSSVTVRVMATDEDAMIARHTHDLCREQE